MIESFNIMQDRLTRMRLAGDPPDVHITPRIGHVGWLDFHHAAEAIAVGQAATEKAIEAIAATIAPWPTPWSPPPPKAPCATLHGAWPRLRADASPQPTRACAQALALRQSGCSRASPPKSRSIWCSRCLTTSPIDTMPTRDPDRPRAHDGICPRSCAP